MWWQFAPGTCKSYRFRCGTYLSSTYTRSGVEASAGTGKHQSAHAHRLEKRTVYGSVSPT